MELSLLLCVIVSFIITFVIGNYLYKLEHKKAFNFLNTFPFEMESKKEYKLTLLFRILLSVFILFSCIDILFLFFYNYDSQFNTMFLGTLLILESFMILGIFMVSSYEYKGHLIISAIMMVLNCISYLSLGYISLINELPLWNSITSFIIGFVLLLILFSPLIKNGFKLEKRVEEQEVITQRFKFNLYVFSEWINILFFVIILILYSINYL